MLGRMRNDGTGGNEIDLALYETMLPFLKDVPQSYRHLNTVTERSGNTPGYVSPGGSYRTGSGDWIFISGTGDRVFKRLMHVIGRADLANAPEFQQNRDRVIGRPVLDGAIDAWLSERSTEEALSVLAAAEVPADKIQSIADIMTHPQVIARGNFVEVPDHDRGDVCMTAPMPRLSEMPAMVRWPGQDLGESNDEILRGELGLSVELLEGLRQRGIVG